MQNWNNRRIGQMNSNQQGIVGSFFLVNLRGGQCYVTAGV